MLKFSSNTTSVNVPLILIATVYEDVQLGSYVTDNPLASLMIHFHIYSYNGLRRSNCMKVIMTYKIMHWLVDISSAWYQPLIIIIVIYLRAYKTKINTYVYSYYYSFFCIVRTWNSLPCREHLQFNKFINNYRKFFSFTALHSKLLIPVVHSVLFWL